MPRKQQVLNPDLINFTLAKNLLGQIASKGIPVDRLSEEVFEGGQANYLVVTDPTWEDDGAQHIFYASVWGRFVDVSDIARVMSSAGTWLNKFVRLGTMCFQTDSSALTESLVFEAIENLPGAAAGLNSFFALDWAIAPTAPNEDGSTGSGHVINGPDQKKQEEKGPAQTVSL